MNTKIPKNILPHLLEIADRLWSGHAAIMIGAGFSKNAKRGESTTKEFCTWNELGNCFYKKLHSDFPSPEDLCYLNVPKLADEVQAVFGRNTLNQILKSELPDKEYQPSLLHEKTLQLPWADVFTTNYDTLLERTADNILQQRYETVINKEDLILSTKPRIIKLHGSFPSERPFTITEEDYRKYPHEFAPFVNTVQQSLLENTLCLIGFSGEDPNFQRWIGWIRDNLGKENSPKIYLIGYLSLSIGQKKLLEDRNIVPIDFSECIEIINCKEKDRHEKALTIFIDFLSEQRKVEKSLTWPNNESFFRFKHDEDINSQIKTIIKEWKEKRLCYPNWVIVPSDNRTVLQKNTEYSYGFINYLKDYTFPLDIEFLYEINWRLEKCLIPIFNQWIKEYESVIEKYNPYPELIQIDDSIIPNAENKNIIDWDNLGIMWIELQFSMLRFYREEFINDKWDLLATRLNKLRKYFSPELTARYHYERCLYYLFSLNIQSVKNELNLWGVDISLPFWEAKRAGLLAELGEVLDAEKTLSLSLKSVRSSLNLSPLRNDYSKVSQEAYILQLLRNVKYSVNHIQRVYEPIENYTDRWNTLVQYKCDPWTELKTFELFLQSNVSSISVNNKKYDFDLDRVTTTYNMGGGDNYVQIAYSFLRYFEETGIPFKLPGVTIGNDAAKKAIARIANYSPSWSFISLIRIGDTGNVNSLFGRKTLSFMSQKSADGLIKIYLSALSSSKTEISRGNLYSNHTFAISLSTVIPEILSRLCVKCSYDIKINLLCFLKELYLCEFRDNYKGVMNLVKRLIKSFSENQLYSIIPLLLDFPIFKDSSAKKSDEYVDPFEFIKMNFRKEFRNQALDLELDKINKLLSLLSSIGNERQTAITRLFVLWKCNLLSLQQTEKFGELLWSKTDNDTGFPIDSDFYYFAYLKLPHPQNINPELLLKKYFEQSKIFVQSQTEEKSISFHSGKDYLFTNIIGTSDPMVNFTWESKELNILLNQLLNWWDADKKYLKDDRNVLGPSVYDEFKARFMNVILVFSRVILPNNLLINTTMHPLLLRMLDEFEFYRIPELEAKTAILKLIQDEQSDLVNVICRRLLSRSEEYIQDALNAITNLSKQQYKYTHDLIKFVSEIIRCRLDVDSRYLTFMYVLFRDHSELIEEDILNDLEIGLLNLLQEIIITINDTEETVFKKLKTKNEAIYLVLQIKVFLVQNRYTIPDYITLWESICHDSNEFSDITNIWENNRVNFD